jgi:hypothetical protein
MTHRTTLPLLLGVFLTCFACLNADAHAETIPEAIAKSGAGYKYLLFRPWNESQQKGYVFRSNHMERVGGVCFYNGEGVYLTRSGDGFITDVEQGHKAAVFSDEKCPVLSGSFVTISSYIDKQSLSLIRTALDAYWRSACAELDSECPSEAATLVAVTTDEAALLSQVTAQYSSGAILIVQKKGDHYVAGGPIPLDKKK